MYVVYDVPAGHQQRTLTLQLGCTLYSYLSKGSHSASVCCSASRHRKGRELRSKQSSTLPTHSNSATETAGLKVPAVTVLREQTLLLVRAHQQLSNCVAMTPHTDTAAGPIVRDGL